MGAKRFKSIHIDTEKKIYLLNGKELECVQYLALEFEKGDWSLSITKDESYCKQQPIRLRDKLRAICENQKTYSKRLAGSKEPMMWRRFELLAVDETERARLERVIAEHGLSRQDLAIILFGLRVRPGFGKKDFGI